MARDITEKSVEIRASPEKVWELLARDRVQEWDEERAIAIKIIEGGGYKLNKIITHIYPLRDVEIAFQTVIKRKDAVIKALLNPWP